MAGALPEMQHSKFSSGEVDLSMREGKLSRLNEVSGKREDIFISLLLTLLSRVAHAVPRPAKARVRFARLMIFQDKSARFFFFRLPLLAKGSVVMDTYEILRLESHCSVPTILVIHVIVSNEN